MEMMEPFILCQLAFPICRLLVFMNPAVFSPQSLCKRTFEFSLKIMAFTLLRAKLLFLADVCYPGVEIAVGHRNYPTQVLKPPVTLRQTL